MANSNKALDIAAFNAVEEVFRLRGRGEKVGVVAVARKYGVDRMRVVRRMKGVGPRRSRIPPNRKLDEAQEAALLLYIHNLDDIGQSLRLDQLRSTANSILKQDYTGEDSPPIVSDHWTQRFLERYPGLCKMKQKPLELERKLAHDPRVFSNWFRRFHQLRTKYGVADEDIWTFDETGFRIGMGKSQWIVTFSTSKRAYLASETCRELVTSIEAVSAGGIVIQPMLILPAKTHLERHFSDLEDDVLLGVSESGYNNNELAYKYIHHLDAQTQKYQKSAHRILVCDEYKSHFTREILEYCEQQNIHIFALPPHTSHLLQPLDVVLFQPYKHFHARAVDQATRSDTSRTRSIPDQDIDIVNLDDREDDEDSKDFSDGSNNSSNSSYNDSDNKNDSNRISIRDALTAAECLDNDSNYRGYGRNDDNNDNGNVSMQDTLSLLIVQQVKVGQGQSTKGDLVAIMPMQDASSLPVVQQVKVGQGQSTKGGLTVIMSMYSMIKSLASQGNKYFTTFFLSGGTGSISYPISVSAENNTLLREAQDIVLFRSPTNKEPSISGENTALPRETQEIFLPQPLTNDETNSHNPTKHTTIFLGARSPQPPQSLNTDFQSPSGSPKDSYKASPSNRRKRKSPESLISSNPDDPLTIQTGIKQVLYLLERLQTTESQIPHCLVFVSSTEPTGYKWVFYNQIRDS
ncbi:hypothetical protein EPUS_09427 [Endocarpon pusillum Z07020]|uniref:HTH CENPB-type domain-containing protein n=1 Tax=Endocarpon pusillum (strain Z07020 / HMAS-L-300199) TaxID=1263415 RepID=U1HKE6_ENDPU|nr:uncharacterized protein EPUS_09427 [Endocarpon pusillum Z07020]ERF69424.1 hypothetical protein EPUS_09427 [Endocarpon pusillum Z07020]